MRKDTYRKTPQGVEIMTQSGPIRGSQKSCYIKFVTGYIDGGGWTGASKLDKVWTYASEIKPNSCSWYAYGLLIAREQNMGFALAQDSLSISLDNMCS